MIETDRRRALMNNPAIYKDMFAQSIRQAAECLRSKDCDNAYGLIVEAMRIDPNAPHPHNLLGIFYEITGDRDLARRHYRAAYSLDPTYKPACSNLERVCMDHYNKQRSFDFGDLPDETDAHSGIKQLKCRRT